MCRSVLHKDGAVNLLSKSQRLLAYLKAHALSQKGATDGHMCTRIRLLHMHVAALNGLD